MEDEELSYRIRGCIFEVYRQLGHGFLEKVYEKALLREFELQGISAVSQQPLLINYKECSVGEYFADILVENRIIIELKAQKDLTKQSEAQLLNYLRASKLKLGFLVNFTYPKAAIKRIVL